MKLRVLGSSGAEFPGFNPPAFLIDDSLLMDAGTIGSVLGPEQQWKLRHIIVTHAHLDHVRGIPFLADNILIKNKKHSITVTGSSQVLRILKKSLLNHQVWPDFTVLPSEVNPVVLLNPIRKGRTYEILKYRITAHEVTHSVPATGYIIESKRGRKLVYTGDTGPTERLWKAVRSKVDCLIIETSMPNSLKELAIKTGHLTPGLLKVELRKMYELPERILITHPKPQYRKKIISELKALKLNNLHVLSDGEEFSI